jgi:phosphonate transport system permease protein
VTALSIEPEQISFGGTDSSTRAKRDTSPQHPSARGLWRRRRWLLVTLALVVWSFHSATAGRGRLVNPGGWTQVDRFLSSATHPLLSSEFLKTVVGAAATSVGYALIGTFVALTIGVVGGVVTCGLWSKDDPFDQRRGKFARQARGKGLAPIRLLATAARGTHEAVWALVLVSVLGRNPLVAILALGLPFGAITSKVVGDIIDAADPLPFHTLRSAGARRLTALIYGVAPTIVRDVSSYGFYRFECALRSSVVLGAIGAGGLGFQLSLSFQGLQYNEIWTLIYTVIVMSALADWWSMSVRRRPTRRKLQISAIVATGLTVAALVRLEVDPGTLFNARARRLGADLAEKVWPPKLPVGGWSKLVTAAVDTLHLSVIAITVAAAIAGPIAFLAARPRNGSRLARSVSGLTRVVLLVMRSVPPTVWALMILFVVFPGPLPGGLALGCYTIGVLGRLQGEVVENADQSAFHALRVGGAPLPTAFAYGLMPVVAPRFAGLTTYRWEVAARETVIVGVVGAGGLGRLLGQQNAAFDEARMLTTVIALIVLSACIDIISRRIRLAVG